MNNNDIKIDFVIPWVDGSDPNWLEEKNKYSSKKIDNTNSVNRYRDWGLLKYWFRGIEQFTPWVNKIYFITWGHLPDFLNINHPKLKIVNHKDYIPKEYLPTFSSHTIEWNVHKINGLSEQFILFNDDTFIIREMSKGKFFKDGLPCAYGAESLVEPKSTEVWQHILVNDISILNKNFTKKNLYKNNKMFSCKYDKIDLIREFFIKYLFPNSIMGFKNIHAPNSFLKSTFEEIWKKEFEILDNTCFHKFRSSDDVNQWLAIWWQVCSGQFNPHKVDNIITACDKYEEIDKIITNQCNDMICINDPNGEFDFDFLSDKIKKSFEKILPNKSSFEK